MVAIHKVSSVGNYTVANATHTIETVVKNPSALKKAFQIAIKVFAFCDLQTLGKLQDRHVTEAMKGSIEFLEFYGSFQNIMFFINPFSKGTLDKEALRDSLIATMCAPIPQAQVVVRQANEVIARAVVDEVMTESAFYSSEEVRATLIKKLVDPKHGRTAQDAQAIADRCTIKQKDRPLTLLFSKACFTTVDLVGNVITLKKWGLVDLPAIAAQIGGQSRVFLFVAEVGVGQVLGVIASAALIVTFSAATHRAVCHAIDRYYAATPQDKEKAYQELRAALFDMLSSGADLVNTASPLVFALNPPVIIALAIFAKGTGLICILLK